MKHKIIALGVLTTLAFHALDAQKRLPASVRVNAVNWTYSMVKSMHAAGFDMPTLPKAGTFATQTPATIDSTLSYFHFPGGVPDSVPIVRTTFRHPAPGVSEETEFRWENNRWQTFSRTTFVKDDQDRLLEVKVERFNADEEDLAPESKLVLHPHQDDPERLDSFFLFRWNAAAAIWKTELRLINRFDAQDRILESSSFMSNMGDPMTFKERYTYNDNGLNIRIDECRLMGTDEVPSGLTNIQYGEQLLPIEYLVSAMVGQQMLPMSRTNIAYYVNGAMRRKMDFERNHSTQSWRLVQTLDFTYDNASRLIARELSRHMEEERFYEYLVYTQAGDLYTETSLHWDDDLFDWVLDGRKYYYYGGKVSADPGPLKAGPLQIMPNPAAIGVQLDIQEPVQVSIFNQQGQEVKNMGYQPDEWLDLVDLPNGLYVMVARSDTRWYTGKLVKQNGN